jgi:27-O-demethylrifamycin SV methyltransferase
MDFDISIDKNRDIYDHADDSIWFRAVYNPVHDGFYFANIGGRFFLDFICQRTQISSHSEVLDICCGSGAPACYLAGRYGCAITGVDINNSQIERAKRRAQGLNGLKFYQSDACEWKSDARYDLVFALDSLTLISDLEGLFKACLAACRPGGTFAVAEVVARDQLSQDMRRFALEEDGVVRLESSARLTTLIEAAGFEDVETVNWDDEAVRVFTIIHDSVRRSQDWLDVPVEKISEWKILTERYLSAFKSGELGYVGIVAKAP